MVTVPDDYTKTFEVVLNKLIEAGWKQTLLQMMCLSSAEACFYLLARNIVKSFKECKESIATLIYIYHNESREFHILWHCLSFLLTFHMVSLQWKDVSV